MKSKKNPKISVITAVYNGERFLVKTIESILNQTFKNFEYILINDCSKDKSLKIMKEYKKKDKRIVLINNKKNIGSASSRNLGLKMARGGYIAILDHDDLALPERLEKEQNYLEKNPDIFLVSGQSINIDEFGNETTKIKNETD
jgi:glycosyltransferase involved in cell wall biosynthesis